MTCCTTYNFARFAANDIKAWQIDLAVLQAYYFGRHGEWKKHLATKILAKVANWWPTDLKRNLLEKLPKIPDEFNQ